MTPSINIIAHTQHFSFDNSTTSFLGAKISPWQKNLAHRHKFFHPRGVASALDLIIKEWDWDLNMNARAVASFSICIHRTPMPDSF